MKKAQCPWGAQQATPLPLGVASLSDSSHRPVLDPMKLLFRQGSDSWDVPNLRIRSGNKEVTSWVYYFWQGDGSLAVYAHLQVEFSDIPYLQIGMLFLGTIDPEDWAEATPTSEVSP